MAKPRQPTKVSVGYITYAIRPWPAGEAERDGSWGECDHKTGVIKVHDGLPSSQAANTLLHEILHGVWAVQSLPPQADEETAVNNTANGFLRVMWDNPDLVAYLMACKPR